MLDEGYIKYRAHWEPAPPLEESLLADIISVRNYLHQQQLIGVYPDLGVGYGNISIKPRHFDKHSKRDDTFVISGTQTGHIPLLTPQHFTTVVHYDIPANTLTCEGPIQASSEALTHAMIYELSDTYQAVIHIHNLAMWQRLMHQVPTTDKNIPYGTPEMATAIQTLYTETDLAEKKIVVMAGHDEGIITFGKDLDEALAVLQEYH